MNKVAETCLWSLRATADDCEEEGMLDRANVIRLCAKTLEREIGDAIKIKAPEPEAAPAQEPVAVQVDRAGERDNVRKPAAAGAQAEAAAQSSGG